MELSLKMVPISILILGIGCVVAQETPPEGSFQLITRSEWTARQPIKPASSLSVLPPPYVVISHTATANCFTQAQCSKVVLSIQNHHMGANGWDDIGYNFLVGGDGNIYEGRGWDVQGAHTKNYNAKSIGISFIGTFQNEKPTDEQLEAAKNFLEYGLKNGKISNDYKLMGQRQLSSTISPGDVLYNIIKTWDHWSLSP